MNPAAILQLLSLIIPNVSSLILAIRKTDGTVETMTLLDSADANFKANVDQVTAWMQSHQQ